MRNFLKSWYLSQKVEKSKKQLERELRHKEYILEVEKQLRRVQYLKHLELPIYSEKDEASNS